MERTLTEYSKHPGMSIQMDQLQVDLQIEILSRLPFKNLARCRCVSKSWLGLIVDPRFTQAHLARSSLTNGPSLILSDAGYFTPGRIYFAEHDQTHDYSYTSVRMSAPPDFKEFRVVGSCNGLLCLVHHKYYKYMICVFNPFTGEYVEIPDPTSKVHLPFQGRSVAVIGFGFSSKTNDYKVVVIIAPQRCGLSSKVTCYTLGDKSWRELEEIPCVRYPTSYLNGVLHWMRVFTSDPIVSFDIANEVFGQIPHPQLGNGYERCYWSLGVLRGCLSIMGPFDDRVEIWVMEKYGVQESWTKCLSINLSQVGRSIRFCQTLCFERDGKLLLLDDGGELLLYDPQTLKMGRFRIGGLPSRGPSRFEAIIHVGSFAPLSDCLRRKRQM